MRLLLGVLLVLGSVVVGSRVVSGAGRTQPVWAVTHDLAAGTRLTRDDLEVREVRLDAVLDGYLPLGADDPSGRVLARAVSAHELLPRAAVLAGEPEDRRSVTVAVEPAHLPPGLDHGWVVDVWVTRGADQGGALQDARPPVRVLASETVDSVDRDPARLGASGSSVAVVLTVPADDVPALVSAIRVGGVDLVAVDDR